MVHYPLLLVAAALGIASCVVVNAPGTGAPVEVFTHRTANSDVVLLWNCFQPAAGVLRIQGIAHSPWQAQPIRHLEVQAVGVDARGRQTGEAVGKARDVQIFTNQRSPFQLGLPTTGAEVRVDLYYQYLLNEEYDTTMVAGPPTVGPRLHAQTRSNVVRDACSPTQHLAR